MSLCLEPPGLRTLHHPAASRGWDLALLISIPDFCDTGSFIIQGKPGDETGADILPTGA